MSFNSILFVAIGDNRVGTGVLLPLSDISAAAAASAEQRARFDYNITASAPI